MQTTSQQSLLCHGTDTPANVTGIAAVIARVGTIGFSLAFRVNCDPVRIKLPPWRPARRADNLWTTTCFEMFARRPGRRAYTEMNFSPSSQWAAYSFTSYRDGMAALDGLPGPDITCACDEAGVSITITGQFPPHLSGLPISIGLSAVIEHTAGSKSYWALRHPPGDPDFHHADCFALSLDAPVAA